MQTNEALAGYGSVNPWVISRDTDAEINFLTATFGARERPGRMVNADGTIAHAEIEISGTVIMLFDSRPEWMPLPSHLRVYVDDVAATLERAVAAGSRVVTNPTELFWGDRVSRIRDAQGHLWWVFQRGEALAPDVLSRRAQDRSFAEAMTYVQESLARELDDFSSREG